MTSSFTTRIIIPTRGGVTSKMKTIQSIPKELHHTILLVAAEPVPYNVDQIVIGDSIGITDKRQFIHQMQKDFGEDYIMVDDDVVLWSSGVDGKLHRATLEDMMRFHDLCVEHRNEYGLISAHPRFFCNRSLGFYNGLSKFVYHNVEKTSAARYDKTKQFEDIEFYLQLIESGVQCVMNNTLVDVNDFSEHDDSYESRGEIIRRWAKEYPNAITIKDEPSLIAGKKKVPYKIRINWSYAKKKPSPQLEFEDA